MRFRPLCLPRSLPALLACGLAITLGCAGAGSSTGKAGSSGSGTAGTSSAGTSGTAGTTGSAGTTGGAGTSGNAGTTGSAGSTSPGAGGVAGTTSGAAGTGRQQHLRQQRDDRRRRRHVRRRGHDRQRRHRRHLPDGDARIRAEDPDRLPGGRPVGQHVPLPHREPACLRHQGRHVVVPAQDRHPDGGHAARNAGPLRVHDHLRDQSEPAADRARGHRGHARRQRRPGARTTQPTSRRSTTVSPGRSRAESSTSRKEVRVAGELRDHGRHQGAHGFTAPGDKYIIFITDGQEDYCDDALEICASDSTVGALQAAFAANIRTIVFGLQTTQFNLPGAVLDAFANGRRGRADGAVLGVRSRCDRDLRSVPGRHALAHRPDRVGPPDHARTDGGGGDVCDDGGTDQALQAERRRSDHAGHAAVDGAGGREELHVRPQRRQRQDDQGRHDEAGLRRT